MVLAAQHLEAEAALSVPASVMAHKALQSAGMRQIQDLAVALEVGLPVEAIAPMAAEVAGTARPEVSRYMEAAAAETLLEPRCSEGLEAAAESMDRLQLVGVVLAAPLAPVANSASGG